MIVQGIYNNLCDKLGGDINPNVGSLDRLCSTVALGDPLRDDKLALIGSQLNQLDGPNSNTKLNALMSDIRFACEGNKICNDENLNNFVWGWVRSWKILFKQNDLKSEELRIVPDNLIQLDEFIVVENAVVANLESSFQGTKEPKKWVELKFYRVN